MTSSISDALPRDDRLPPRENMLPSARKLRDIYAIRPGAPLFHREFGFYCLERWLEEGLPKECNLAEEFGYDPPGSFALGGLGWCEAAFDPPFETKVLEDRGSYELVQDHAGRKVLYFKGRRDGFMPEYVDHPVKDLATWETDVAWRLDPDSPARASSSAERVKQAAEAARAGLMISQHIIGGYMYLRSLIGPSELPYALHDDPALIHTCMRAWLRLAESVTAAHQQVVTLDEVYLAEDICYNHGPLLSPAMFQQFLAPYYADLLASIRARQRDKGRHLYIHIDTDGDARPVIPWYRALGMDAMSPFEVAAGCDVVEIGRQYPDLVIMGGIDKRILATTPAEIDRMVERILPAMRARGGYIPTCDHGVPAEVSLANYRHYRKRCLELAG